MQIPLKITYRDFESTPSLEAKIRERAEGLERFYDRLTGCHVTIGAHHHRHRKGRLYHATVHLLVPDGEIVVKRDPAEDHAREDVYVAIRDAFDAARRQLEDYRRRQQGVVKQHEVQPFGTVERIFPEDGYGFIRSALDGQEVYFHRNAVLSNEFDGLQAGAEVRFVLNDREGEKGAQASSVTVVGKHHPTPPTL